MKILPAVFLFIFSILNAQLTEDFETSLSEDWEQSSDGCWANDSSQSISGIYSLHHIFDDSISGNSQISLIHDKILFDSSISVWKFKIKHGYDPSSNNNWAVFFASDKKADFMNPWEACKAYIIGVNYTGSDDTIKVWKSIGNSLECILNTGVNWQEMIGSAKAAGIQIKRFEDGNWEINLDTSGNNKYSIPLGTFSDTSINSSCYFGIYYKYSSRQDQKLWFDDLFINGHFENDTQPPDIISYWISNNNSVIIEYNEKINDTVKLNSLLSDLFDNSIASWQVTDNLLKVNYLKDFQTGSSYSFTIDLLSDIYRNMPTSDTVSFVFYKAKNNDVIVTEIMADPDPPVQLPNAEYIEIINKADLPISLDGWRLYIGNSCSEMCCRMLNPGEYLILCDDNYSETFKPFGNFLSINNFPAITNLGQTVIIKDSEENIIFALSYSDEWYPSVEKKNGGWSLEMIDINNPCGGEKNWTASTSFLGGTPGGINSMNSSNPDNISPFIEKAVIIDDSALFLQFSERLEYNYLNDPYTYFINNGIGNPQSINSDILLNKAELFFNKSFENNILYSLQINQYLSDCTGNILTGKIISFKKPDVCDSNDIIINEILFDPFEEGGEFVEIYNRSQKVINIQDFKFYKKDIVKGEIGASVFIIENPYTIESGNYLVLTGHSELVSKYYKFKDAKAILEIDNFPALPNTETIIGLMDTTNKIVDEVHYSEDMIFEMINKPKGISIERTSSNQPSNNIHNWHSASADAGYATPGFLNSQSKESTDGQNSFTIHAEVFSPDGDGYDDIMTIHYSLNDPGYISNISIFNNNGMLVKTISKNAILGTSGIFTWDGLTDEKKIANIGIYLVYIEIFNTNGKVLKFKKSCVVAEKIK